MLKEEVEGCPLPTRRDEGPPTDKMIHYCDQCDYKSYYRSNVKQHRYRKYKTEYVLPFQNEEQPKDKDLMEDSIQVFKIYKLLQRMKNK